MINLTDVAWKQDGITDDFKRENESELRYPERMSVDRLGVAVTYCKTISNPYAEELMRRAGNLEAFRSTDDPEKQHAILRNAAKSFGFILL